MGGLAIKNAYTRRYEKEEFDELVPEVLSKMKLLFTDAKITKAYRNKDTFGDMDVLCLVDKPITINIRDFIQENFNSKEIVKNGHVYSFEYKELQIDLILVKEKYWETTNIYFSYNDLHNLVGKIAHRFGLKWGMKGLVYDYKIGGKKLGTIEVTKDYRKALNFLGFDVYMYDQGFDDLKDIFEFVTESKYFAPRIYDFENLNKVNRDRDKKRNTYASFIEYIKPYKEQPLENFHYFYKDKNVYLGLIDYYFPGFLKQYRELEKKEELNQKLREKFNGNIIMENTNLKGKELGEAITKFKDSFESTDERNNFILNASIENILNYFKQINDL